MSQAEYNYNIITNQTGPHSLLWQTFCRHRSDYLRPISTTTATSWELAVQKISRQPKPIIIDSGCGKGHASAYLSKQFPDHWILAIDQSVYRLKWLLKNTATNIIVLPGNCVDYWRLIAEDTTLDIRKHYVLYPNPWPKKKHLYRRWHGHPVAKTFFAIAPLTIIRSNWLIYLQEAMMCAQWFGHNARIKQLNNIHFGLSHFENKYINSATPIYELDVSNI